MAEFALFANIENCSGNAQRALQASINIVLHAEQLGFEQAWLTEHHFNAFSISASILPLLSHLAGRTRHIQLGAAAVLLPLHNPIRVAEDLATIDALAEGRLLLGVGRGGPFPEQFRNFGIDPEQSRERMVEALTLIEKILGHYPVDFAGKYYQASNLSVFPRPPRPRLPTWLASLHSESMTLAAQRGYGLMAPSAAPINRLAESVAQYRRICPQPAQPLVVARYFLCAEDDAAARREAAPFIRDFAINMRNILQQYPASPALQPFGQNADAFAEETLLANAVVGDPAACIDRCLALREAIGPHVLLLKPASYNPQINQRSLTLFAERVRPYLP